MQDYDEQVAVLEELRTDLMGACALIEARLAALKVYPQAEREYLPRSQSSPDPSHHSPHSRL